MTLEHGGDLFAAQQVYSGEILDFSVNINPLGPAPQALEAARAALERAGEYPCLLYTSRGIIRRNKMLHAAIALFLEHGYEKTTTAQIARQAGMSPASFFAAFENKEALLLALTKIMFSGQFQKAEGMLAEVKNPLLLYGLETALQLHITELSEPLRELYVTAYTLPTTSDFIYRSMLGRLCEIFRPYLPDVYKRQ